MSRWEIMTVIQELYDETYSMWKFIFNAEHRETTDTKVLRSQWSELYHLQRSLENRRTVNGIMTHITKTARELQYFARETAEVIGTDNESYIRWNARYTIIREVLNRIYD